MPWPYSNDLRLVRETEREFVFKRLKTGATPFLIFGFAFLAVGGKLLMDADDRFYGFVFVGIGAVCAWVAARRLSRRETLAIDFASRTCALAHGRISSPETDRSSLDALRIQGIELTPGIEITSTGRRPGGIAQVSFVFDDHEPVTVFESADAAAAQATLEALAKKLRLPATLYEWNDDLSELNPRRIP